MSWKSRFGVIWRHRATRHAISWLLVIAFLEYADTTGAPSQLRLMGVPYSTALLLVPAAIVYAHFALLTHALERRRYGWYALGLLATLVGGTALLYAARDLGTLTMVQVGASAGRSEVGIGMLPGTQAELLGQCLANVVIVLGASAVVRYLRRGIVAHYQMQQLRAQQLDTELRLLKSQVNQHFLFNTLNNLYGLSLAAPDQLPEALLKLADLMRYQLDGSRQAHTTVGGEADYLASYIGLEKLRLRSNTQVEFTADVPRPEQPLAPLLLLPLVENCFKHAVAPSGQNTIRIQLVQTDAGLTLRTTNSIPLHFRPAPSGLGLPTLRARLAQFYPGPQHRLTIEATPSHYAATLTLCP
ncbi:sensor histidine kinase [Hymenobacter weizhouensis]|uniref:sensor histidine kinase n=1 Tax=Hymenobacter sp. YIM 151500-1 TaxID=2987689 RepID=UPI002226ED14|nr:sensor histidine kinase [Hymenobacter sp. YIM 151500-1]UYZ61646.1 histidine kinase [Hymenobacter sp. YIM 151500-1]